METLKYSWLEEWISRLVSLGENAFSLEKVSGHFKDHSQTAIKRSLARLSAQGKILSIHRGYYLIIYPLYNIKGIIPPTLFIDGLMKHLERPYYLGLLTAAQFYGAAHHAPQETYVITTRPTMRPIQKKGIKINFISVNNIRDEFTETRNTPTGTVHISSPVLTAIDLVDFDNKIGRISRVATVLNELAESMKPEDFNDRVLDFAKASTLQRLGYLFENSIDQKELADSLFDKMAKKGIKLHKIRLHSHGKSNGFAVDERWQVIVNAIIEIDE